MKTYKNLHGLKRLGHILHDMLPISMFRIILSIYHGGVKLCAIPKSLIARWRVKNTIDRICRGNRPIRFGFYVVLESMFQMRRVFELMMMDSRFDPFIVVVPRIGYQEGDMEATVEKTYSSLVRDFPRARIYKGYENVVYNNRLSDCDACAMMNLYRRLADERFETEHFARRGIPIFGANYSYTMGSVQTAEYFGMPSLKYVFRFYCSNEREKWLYQKYQRIPADSKIPVVTGCAKSDAISNVMEPRDGKTILIAPHHSVIPSVDSGICLGNFLRYKDFILDLPNRYPKIHWVLRPHPHLKLRLTKNVGWSMEQWDAYVKAFDSLPNAEYESGGVYYDSFERSDAIINDCGSFLAEYFYTGKPHCYMLASAKAKDEQFDAWGHELLAHTYQAFSEEDITRFIDDVVIGGKDTMREMRQKFAKEKVMINYPHASEAILEDIAETLGRGRKHVGG